MRLLIGLGNPGPRYVRTRHNIGFRLADRLAGDEPWKDFQGMGLWCRRDGLLLAKPMTFMNESGRFAAALAHFYKITPSQILACFDDVALPLGRLRLRPLGSSGGHKGMDSLIEALGTQELARLRIGVGPQPPGMDSAAFVLSRFASAEEEALETVLKTAEEAVHVYATDGLETAMNRFNPAP